MHDEEFEGMVEEMERFRFEKMVHENYKNIKEKGIDIVTMAEYQDETIDRLKTTLGVMLDFFEKREEYEKCADIRDISDKIKEHGL
jgi:CTP:phosphocholine cytidylyltransferase-like protein